MLFLIRNLTFFLFTSPFSAWLKTFRLSVRFGCSRKVFFFFNDAPIWSHHQITAFSRCHGEPRRNCFELSLPLLYDLVVLSLVLGLVRLFPG